MINGKSAQTFKKTLTDAASIARAWQAVVARCTAPVAFLGVAADEATMVV